jgi:hypothetical protein
MTTGNGIEVDASQKLDTVITKLSLNVLRRICMYLTGYKSEIELYKIGRDGLGVELSVNLDDIGVNHFLCTLCVLYPAALMKTSSGFKVKNGPLMWSIKDRILKSMAILIQHLSKDAEKETPFSGWKLIPGDNRKMWDHQRDTVNTMIRRHNNGKKGNIISIPTGMGKTLIVMEFIRYLTDNNQFPSTCVYTLPPSAVDSIKVELDMFGIPYHEIDMRLASHIENKSLKKYVVNLIVHDHMRLNGMDEQLRDATADMFFIVDEFHKTMNDSIRTSLALEICRLSSNFIAMSGTIVLNTNVQAVINWLEQVVDFEVTTHNYFVAIGAMISKRVYTNIIVERIPIDVVMSNEEKEVYSHLVPHKLGGIAPNINLRAAMTLCYEACTLRMIDDILFYVGINEIPFVVANNIKHQHQIRSNLQAKGVSNVYLIGKDTPLTLNPGDQTDIQVVITTPTHSAGYTMTKCKVMIQTVTLGNQLTRDQLEGRLVRISQTSPNVVILTYHTGVLTYILNNYEKARTLSSLIKGFADLIDLNVESVIDQIKVDNVCFYI